MLQCRGVKVHVVSVNPVEGRNVDQVKALHELWESSDRRHMLVETAEKADLCLVCNISGPGWFSGLRNHPIVNACPEKCFAVHDGDIAVPLLHGIYTAASKKMMRFGRIRGGAYNLFPASTRNPFVEASNGKAFLHPKSNLLSFWGQDSSSARQKIFHLPKTEGIEIINTTGKFTAFAGNLPEKETFQRRYFEILQSSRFALCPRGVSPSSIRLFEAMKMGVAPVIVSDSCLLPSGPRWADFALVVAESQIPTLANRVLALKDSYQEMGARARQAYEIHFADNTYFNYLVAQAREIQASQLFPERFFWCLRHLKICLQKLKGGPSRN